MRYFAGIDSGALSTEAVVIDEKGRMIGEAVLLTGADPLSAVKRAYDTALGKAELAEKDISFVVATGYGRGRIPFASLEITEISCHAKGMSYLFPKVRTIIDIGGQDTKAIRVNEEGKVVDFAMNDKCAAGTGRFLEVMANALEVSLEEMGELALKAKREVKVSSMCTVFAESEVVSLIAEGHPKEEILLGVASAIADRTMGLIAKIGLIPDLAMSGGVAKNRAVVRALAKKLKHKVHIPEEPQLVGALGAALFAREKGG